MPVFLKVRIVCEFCDQTTETEAETDHKFVMSEEGNSWHEEELSFGEDSVVLPLGWYRKGNQFLCHQHRNGV